MQTLVYYDHFQKEDFEKMKTLNPNSIAILSEEMLVQKYVKLEVPILIIMSQPPINLLQALSKYQWTNVIVHIGIRNLDTIKGAHLLFENLVELEQHYKRCREDQREQIKKVYIDGIHLNDPLDLIFIESLYSQGIQKKKATQKIKQRKSIKSGIITIMGNSELAKVFSKSIASQIEGRVLVVDGDFLKPSMSSHFSVNRIQTSVESHLTGIDNTGINIALDALSKGISLESFMEEVILKVNPHLHLLMGNYNLNNYEHYDMRQLVTLLNHLRNLYEVIVLSVSDNIYDQMTMVGIHQGQSVIFAPEKDSVALRYVYQIIPLLKHKQGITDKKMSVVLFEKRDFMRKFKSISKTSVKALFPEHYIGAFTNHNKDMRTLVRKIQERMT